MPAISISDTGSIRRCDETLVDLTTGDLIQRDSRTGQMYNVSRGRQPVTTIVIYTQGKYQRLNAGRYEKPRPMTPDQVHAWRTEHKEVY